MPEQDNLIAPARTPGWIRVLIHGLFVSAFKRGEDNKPILEVGALMDPIPGHRLSLELWDRDSPSQEQPLKDFSVVSNSIAHLAISEPEGIYRHQQIREFKWSGTDDRYDFRWLVDFENHLYRGNKCGKRRIGFRFDVNEGVTFTLLRSLPLRLRTDGGSHESWRRIAQVMAIDIDYREGRTARLWTEGGDEEELSELIRYNVVLRNDCLSTCPGLPNNKSDFTELFRTIIKPSGESDYEVFKETAITPEIGNILMDHEVRGIGGIIDPPEKQLAGLWNTFEPSSPLDGGDSKIDPCGMGFFGASTGVWDQPSS